MLPKNGVIFISARMPDGSIRKTQLPAASEYYIDAKAHRSVILPIEEAPVDQSEPTLPHAESQNGPKSPGRNLLSTLATNQPKLPTSPLLPANPTIRRPTTFPRPPSFGRPQPKPAPRAVPEGFTPKPYVFPDLDIEVDTVSIQTEELDYKAETVTLMSSQDRDAVDNQRQTLANLVSESITVEDSVQIPIQTEKQASPIIPTPWNTPVADSAVDASQIVADKSSRPHQKDGKGKLSKWRTRLGMSLIVLSVVGIAMPYVNKVSIEAYFTAKQVKDNVVTTTVHIIKPELPPAVPIEFNPLLTSGGKPITPINTDFSLIIPKIGVNASVLEDVNPASPREYNAALKKGVAHASTSSTPDGKGTVYLFSHDTNYEWFVKSLNAIFYLVKNLEPGDFIVVYYKNVRYTYRMTDKKIVNPTAVSYLIPDESKKSLILQTCWPPGRTDQRMLIFADLVDEKGVKI